MVAPVPLPQFRTTRRHRPKASAVALLAIALPAVAQTGRPSPKSERGGGQILFSARYYAPPTSRVRTHFHLYLIRPDGSGRRQLTRGEMDDLEPQPSPQGNRVAFLRNTDYSEHGPTSVWLVSLRNGAMTKLEDLTSNDFPEPLRWTPDGKAILVLHHRPRGDHNTEDWAEQIDADTGRVRRLPERMADLKSPAGDRILRLDLRGTRLVDVHGTSVAQLPDNLDHVRWLNGTTLAGVRTGELDPAVVWFDRDGKQLREQKLNDKELDGRIDDLLPGPDGESVLLAVDRSNSTIRPAYEFLRVDKSTGKTRAFTGGQFLTWSPGRDQFCTAPPRELSTYQKLPGGRERSVWTAPLQVGSAKDGKPHTITSGLVWVVGAHWTR